jgi:hypothetical protein
MIFIYLLTFLGGGLPPTRHDLSLRYVDLILENVLAEYPKFVELAFLTIYKAPGRAHR